MPVRGLKLHIRRWAGTGVPFVLVHGLASNCRTWEAVARGLSAAGHAVVAVDQRGHGLSDKPASGYGFGEVTADLHDLIQTLGFAQRPVVAGQSWGGHVVVELAARYPDLTAGLVLVDGGIGDLASRPGATWEQVSVDLRPPSWLGRQRSELEAAIRDAHPDWSDEGVEHSLANFETLPDGTIRPWLSLERHMEILRALWEHRSSERYGSVTVPVLICPAANGESERTQFKREGVAVAQAALPRSRVHWFDQTAHDIHVHRPDALVEVILAALREGFFQP